MTPEECMRLIEDGETYTTEFKGAEINDSEVVEAVVCLANGGGGTVFLGIEDDGTRVGALPRHGDRTDPDRLVALIANRTSPSILSEVSVVDLDGYDVVAIEIPSGSSVFATSDGRFLRRAMDVHGRPQCLPMSSHEVLGRASAIGAEDISARPLLNASFEDLDPLELRRFRAHAGSSGDGVLAELSDRDLLAALGFLTHDDQLRTAAVLLFGLPEAIRRFVPTHETAFQVLEHAEVRVNRIEQQPLLHSMVALVESITPFNSEEEIEVGLFRLGIPKYADVAVRELLANALVHRDYARNGAVSVQIDDGQLSISNPGGLPEGITIENLLAAPPRPRNPLIADAFKRAGLSERTGRGVNRVFHSQLSLGRPAPDYGRSTATWVNARLWAGPADREMAAFIAEARGDGRPFGLVELMVLHEVRENRRISTTEASGLLQMPQAEARAVLNRLVEQGLLEARGERKGRTYHLAGAIYRKLGDPTAYVRTRGFDSIQQEQMVLTFAAKHGSIGRTETADLCQIGSAQASRLLRRIRDEGKLVMHGQRRTARYVVPGVEAI